MNCKHKKVTAFQTRWASGVNCDDCGERLETHRDKDAIEAATAGTMRKQLSKGNLERARERDLTHDRMDDPATWAKALKPDEEPDPNDVAF